MRASLLQGLRLVLWVSPSNWWGPCTNRMGFFFHLVWWKDFSQLLFERVQYFNHNATKDAAVRGVQNGEREARTTSFT